MAQIPHVQVPKSIIIASIVGIMSIIGMALLQNNLQPIHLSPSSAHLTTCEGDCLIQSSDTIIIHTPQVAGIKEEETVTEQKALETEVEEVEVQSIEMQIDDSYFDN